MPPYDLSIKCISPELSADLESADPREKAKSRVPVSDPLSADERRLDVLAKITDEGEENMLNIMWKSV